MMTFDALKAHGLFETGLPRYTSYPTAPVFSAATEASFQRDALKALNPQVPVSVYVHIPFCERLCWFCACRTQGVQSLSPVDHYLDALERELETVASLLPAGITMGRLHWGGGTPTILPPDRILRLMSSLVRVFTPAPEFEFSVEIDPTLVDAEKIVALRAAGMTRASIGVQDFDPVVQDAIGRQQSYAQTVHCVELLRGAGIRSLNLDLVYGLPYQTTRRFRTTLSQVDTLLPDRVALFGYAHVPHMAKRQVLIPQDALPQDRARHHLAAQAAAHFAKIGMQSIGIDHYATPHDSLAKAATDGTLRRNFQGYTTDGCPTLIGLGASSISSFEGGYVQNAAQTSAYIKAVDSGALAGCRGHAHSAEDHLRGDLIEALMCNFEVDLAQLRARYGDLTPIAPALAQVEALFGDLVDVTPSRLQIKPHAQGLVRLIASQFDAYPQPDARYSRAS